MMDGILIDNLVVFFAIIYYLFLCLVYLLRSYERDKLELMFAPVFSLLLVPFVAVWTLNLLNGRGYRTVNYGASNNHLSGL